MSAFFLLLLYPLVNAQVSVFSRFGLLMREIRLTTGYKLDDIITLCQESWSYIQEDDYPDEEEGKNSSSVEAGLLQESPCDLAINPEGLTWTDFIQRGLTLKFKNETMFLETMAKRSKWLVVIAMGRFDQGKTKFISHEKWANRSLNSGITQPTHGICYLLPQHPETQHTIWVDTEGLYRGPDQNFMTHPTSTSDRETDMKRATGSAQLDFLIKQGNVLLWFVGSIDDHAIMNFQNLLNRIEMWDPDNKKKLIVIHNLVTHLYDLEVLYASKSIQIWDIQEQYSPKEDVSYFVTYHDDIGVKKDVIHVFLAREGSPAGKNRNERTIEFVSNLINNYPAQTSISVEEIRREWEEIVPDYIVPKSPNENGCDISYFQENTEWFAMRRVVSLVSSLKAGMSSISRYISYDHVQASQTCNAEKCYANLVQVQAGEVPGTHTLTMQLDFEADVVPVDEYGQPSWLDQSVRLYTHLEDRFIVSLDLPGSEVVIFTSANIDELSAELLAELVRDKFVVFPYGDHIVIRGTRLPPPWGCGGSERDFGFMQKRIKVPGNVPNKEEFGHTFYRGVLELTFRKRRLNLF